MLCAKAREEGSEETWWAATRHSQSPLGMERQARQHGRQFSIVLFSTYCVIWYGIVYYSFVSCIKVLHFLYRIIQCTKVQCRIVWYSTSQETTLHYTALHCTTQTNDICVCVFGCIFIQGGKHKNHNLWHLMFTRDALTSHKEIFISRAGRKQKTDQSQ